MTNYSIKNQIIIVSGDSAVINLLKTDLALWLEKNEVVITVAISLQNAVSRIRKEKTIRTALLLVDTYIHLTNARLAVSQLKNSHPYMPIILLTDAARKGVLKKASIDGVYSFIIKPWTKQYLLTEIKKCYQFYSLWLQQKHFNERIQSQLEWAEEFQRTILGFNLPKPAGLEYTVTYLPVPALQCGGDYYDIISLDQNQSLFIIGDVAGHGIKAAFVTILLKSIIGRSNIKKFRDSKNLTGSLLAWLNKRLQEEFIAFRDLVITLSVCILDTEKHILEYSNAGHVPFFLVRKNKVEGINHPGPALCMQLDSGYESIKLSFQKGDLLVFHTDGLVEFGTDSHQHIEIEIEEIIKRFASQNDMNSHIIKAVLSKAGTNEFTDDATLMTVKIR